METVPEQTEPPLGAPASSRADQQTGPPLGAPGSSRADQQAEPPLETPESPDSDQLTPRDAGTVDLGRDDRAALRRARLALQLRRLAPIFAVYLATRGLLILVAIVQGALGHHAIDTQLSNWDGLWYRQLTNHGYPTYLPHCPEVPPNGCTLGRTTLGFLPLYPISMWLVAHAFSTGTDAAGLIVSLIGGLVATVFVERLASGWWGEVSGRRAAVLFCLFPGSVVFSMMYSEGLLLPLAAGCIYALERRRWLLAGILAGFATATAPDALALIPACGASALIELRRHGWQDRKARRSLLAPVLSTAGVASFAIFLWAWTGTPFATLRAQHTGWGERTDPFALVNQAKTLVREISFTHFNNPTINLNLVIGLLGAVVLVIGLIRLFRKPRQVSIEAMAWTLGIAFLATTSEYVPPNPRLLITAFPAVVVLAHRLTRRGYVRLILANGVLLVVLSAVTFVGTTLRP